MSAIPTVRSAVPVAVVLCGSLLPWVAQSTQAETLLAVRHGPGPTDVTLEWSGGLPPFEVLRSGVATGVCAPESLLAVTDFRIWIDTPPPGAFFYKVRDPSGAGPPEICNGADDDCDGTVDEEASGCSAGACEDCIDGECRSLCGACDDCLGGACQSRCGACQTCTGGSCGPCNPNACQTCNGGACVSTCDESQCLTCVGGGACASICDSCETCSAGTCLDACDRNQCLSCQGGSCQPFCDPVCQVCTPQGCVDNCGPCERCVNGACQARCDPLACEDCIDGMCVSRCAPCEICVAGVCEACDS